ncbi:MAG: hypothetical protein PVI90_09830 [Desulfobacteraceae bacterium]
MRKIVFTFIVVIFVVCDCYATQWKQKNQIMINDDLYYQKVCDRVFMITHYFPKWGGNCLFVLLGNHQGVLIDTPYEQTGTESLLNWINKKFGEVKLTVINTGYHQDNLGGNAVLSESSIPIYGSDLTKTLIETKGDELKEIILESVHKNKDQRYYNSYKLLRLKPPTITFPIQKGLKLSIENETIEVFYPGESHAPDNVVVYLKNKKILFGGCMIKGLMYKKPGFIEHANMVQWPISLQRVKQRYPDCKIVIPGHGDFGGTKLINHMLNVLKQWNATHVAPVHLESRKK